MGIDKTIVFNDNDNFIKVKLEQEVENINLLSLKLTSSDIYESFNSDYGVLIGRVNGNNNVGIENAKISIFIPIDDTDMLDSDIVSIYPYQKPTDKNIDGKRYNLLPRVGKFDNNNNIYKPIQPFGSFPTIEEIIINENINKVYKKYYKYSTVTNKSGDYMIFGVPVGTQTVHLSVDITDIGDLSMSPASMVNNLGYSDKLFNENKTRINTSSDLNDLPNIETQDVSVDIIPFWGDKDNFTIGITRQDFKIRAAIKGTFTIFGSVFTDANGCTRGANQHAGKETEELYLVTSDRNANISIATKRIGNVTVNLYYYPSSVSDDDIEDGTANPITQMKLLEPSEYSFYTKDGSFAIIVNCNRKKKITNSSGSYVDVSDSYVGGIFTEFYGFLTIEYTENDIPMNFSSSIGNNAKIEPFRYKLKFPQLAVLGSTFYAPSKSEGEDENTKNWRKQSKKFTYNKIYSVARFHGLVVNGTNDAGSVSIDDHGFMVNGDVINKLTTDLHRTVGLIITNDVYGTATDIDYTGGETETDYDDTGTTIYNSYFEMENNCSVIVGGNTYECFGANWLNFSIYLPQNGRLVSGRGGVGDMWCNTHYSKKPKEYNEFNNNSQSIAGSETNTVFFARSDLNSTAIFEVPKSDIQIFANLGKKGLKGTSVELSSLNLIGTEYIKANSTTCPNPYPYSKGGLGGTVNASGVGSYDQNYYFFKGIGASDCIKFLVDIGIV